MKLVMTLMVRDEVDIVAAMVEHHLAQGVDLVIATDNGSVDGTREVLAAYAELGVVELHDDPVQRKQQGSVVTQMARRASTVHRADWVLNADADEFWLPVDRSLTLRDALERIPTGLQTWNVPVINMTGEAAERGAGLRRLVYRDERADETLMRTAGLHAQPTADAIHVGFADVSVRQGNHSVNLESTGEPEPGLALEVLHYPWRSYEQYAHKVEVTGVAYEANPTLRPSPNHHGMRDYRRLRAGLLWDFYVYRHPRVTAPGADAGEGFVFDDSLVRSLESLEARRPELLAAVLESADGRLATAEDHDRGAELAELLLPFELERAAALGEYVLENRALKERARKAEVRLAEATRARDRLKRQLAAARDVERGDTRPSWSTRVARALRSRLARS
ncbi:glycosyltransferase family 2 protein [Galbitalea sp. SE-J8]|uniref:glycosyltransferase family 2 protein n=1 Tax=Galbitalea sp. SE-J8 TaxID=3054952 RepID=UPI00259D185F|nr:glycosyltransferase family 2 protein [Galbitalea sp. SE-J8]MDM4762308.1 glycosyltransferase family 2 protein [Galbitalea sp. SE-J8]